MKNYSVKCYFVSGVSQLVKSFGNDEKAANAYADKLNAEAKANGLDYCYDVTPWAD